MDTTTAVVPVLSVILFSVVFYKSVVFFLEDRRRACNHIATCPPSKTRQCREGDKAVIACIGSASILFIIAQCLEWASTGFYPPHDTYMHVWHGYDFLTAVIWLLFVYHLRARLGWRNQP